RGIGVCLVGNFEETDLTPKQLAAARRLIAFLRQRYDIPADRVIPHGAVKATACPGKRLPVSALLPADDAPPHPLAPAATGDDEYLPTGSFAPDGFEQFDNGPSLAAPAGSAAARVGGVPSAGSPQIDSPSLPRFGAKDAR
ncbi:MAG: peptidoglycan recognition family protein, partial [Planctomycetota bacterium]